MKIVLRLFFILLVAVIVFGFYYRSQIDFKWGERIIGYSVLGGTFLYLPLFLYHRWKGKRLKDYTLSEENFKKMREEN